MSTLHYVRYFPVILDVVHSNSKETTFFHEFVDAMTPWPLAAMPLYLSWTCVKIKLYSSK